MSNSHGIERRGFMFLRASLIFAAAFGLLAGSLWSQAQGPKQAKNLAKRANKVVKSMTDSRTQIRVTLNDYNSILGQVEDRTKAYKKLLKAMDKSDKTIATVKTRVLEMNGEANVYFADWGKNVAAIGSDDVRERSQTRLDDSRQRYSEILELGKLAGTEYEGFMSTLRDQVLYLGHDLNPTGVASVSEDAKKLNEDAPTLFAKIDKTTEAFNNYIRMLNPQ